MPDITVHRHGDRWAVAEAGAESPVKEFPTREAAELAARQMAAGGAVEVTENDPTGLEHTAPAGAGEPPTEPGDHEPGGVGAREGARSRQPGL
jgi:hypothetical protein